VLKKKQLLIIGVVFTLFIISISVPLKKTTADIKDKAVVFHGATGPEDLLIPEKALASGISGYVSIKTAKSTAESILVEKGRSGMVQFELLFISHDLSVTETVIEIDPNKDIGWKAGKSLGKDGPLIIINDYVTYDKIGKITLKANEPLILTMTIIPS